MGSRWLKCQRSLMVMRLPSSLISLNAHCVVCSKASYSRWTSDQVRAQFIQHFEENHKHTYVKPSSVVPSKDAGLFFTNAGMNQFRDVFLGTCSPADPMYSLRRAVNSQKCIRMSGKHNDLRDVGYDHTHHTFFEMLGNWSFGDYFKAEAISMAWELLTNVYGIPTSRLYVTYFGGDKKLGLSADLETRDLWLQLGLNPAHVIPGNSKDNFWEMGASGPCGPCSEIHYDTVGGGRDGSHLVNSEINSQVVELWNLVFVQYNRLDADTIEALPKMHVDTGMGLERLVSVLQNKNSNYDTDLFHPIITAISQLSAVEPYSGSLRSDVDVAYRIVSDHMRMICIAVADGVIPGINDNRSLKLRQIIQRMLKFQRRHLSCPPMSATALVDPVVEKLGQAFPELSENCSKIKETLQIEEDLYLEQLSDLYTVIKEFRSKFPDVQLVRAEELTHLQTLYSRRGDGSLPVEALIDISSDFGLKISSDVTSNEADYDNNHHDSKASRVAAGCISPRLASALQHSDVPYTDDSLKYIKTSSQACDSTERAQLWSGCVSARVQLMFLADEDRIVDEVVEGQRCLLVTDKTCFYSESGGQASDTGLIRRQGDQVYDVQSHGRHIVHWCIVLSGRLRQADLVDMDVNQDQRQNSAINHTATHLLNFVLRQQLGQQVIQAGSSVNENELCFSFNYQGNLSHTQLTSIEKAVNDMIGEGLNIRTLCTDYERIADLPSVIRLPNHSYPLSVRLVCVGGSHSEEPNVAELSSTHSAELCGGTHVGNTRDIRRFVITGLTGQSQGVKRLTAVTALKAVQSCDAMNELEGSLVCLQQDVDRSLHADSWSGRLRHMLQTFGEQQEHLPKVAREAFYTWFQESGIAEKIKSQEREKFKGCLESQLSELVSKAAGCTDKHFIIKKLEFKAANEITKPLRKLSSPRLPLIVYNDPAGVSKGQSQMIVVSLPDQGPITDQKLIGHLSTNLRMDILPAKGKNMRNVYVGKLTTQMEAEHLALTITDSLNSYIDQKSQSSDISSCLHTESSTN